MKVLHCIHSLSGGGAERQLKLLVEEANKNGEEYAIFCVNITGNDLPAGLVKIYQSSKRSKLSVFGEIQKAVRDFKPELIHAWLPSSVTIPTMIVGRLENIPVVFSYRNAMKFSRPLMIVEYLVAWFCAKGIASNNPIGTSKRQYQLLFNNKINSVIPNAVKVDTVYKKAVNCESSLPTTILFVGRLTKQKNWKCLIKALPDVISKNEQIKVLICGDGEDRILLLELIEELGLTRYVELRGYEKNVYFFMQQADVLVLPSWYEGMPNVMLEALEIGLPCIVSKNEAHMNLLNGSTAALLFDPESSLELSSQINMFISKDDHQSMVQEGSRLASQYQPKKLANRYKLYYQALI